MILSLPPELLRDILEATVPHTFHSNTYKERQKTLCSLSLVSKLFRSIAQPLLLQIVYVKSVRQLESLPPDTDEGGGGAYGNKGIKSAIVTLKPDIDFLLETIKVGSQFKHVESLTLDGSNDSRVDLSLIQSFKSMIAPAFNCVPNDAHVFLRETDLSNLHLSECRAAIPTSLVFPHLRSLTFDYVDPDTVVALLDPVSLPRLEELAWFENSSIVYPMIERSSFRQLLPQLEVLIFDLRVLMTVTDTEVRSAAPRTLVDCVPYQLSDLSESTFHPVHLRIYDLSDLDEYTQRTTFSKETVKLFNYIESNPSLPLRSVYLICEDPSTVHLSPTSPGYVEDLSRICQERKIDLIFETGPTSRMVDPCLSPDFSRRMKERRMKENVE